MDIAKFHQCLNPNNERLYIPLGKVKGTEITLKEKKDALKKPQTKWKTEQGRLNAEELIQYLETKKKKDSPTVIGFQIPKGLTVVDVDYMPTAEYLTRILEDLKIKHCRLRTNAGKHFIFKAPSSRELSRQTGVATPAGMLIDQLPEVNSYIFTPFSPDMASLNQFKFVMNERKVEKLIPREEIDYIPDWLIGNRNLGKAKNYKLGDMGLTTIEAIKKKQQEDILPIPMTSGNKTDNLQRWLHNLAYRGYSAQFSEIVIRLINRYVCVPPIPDATLDTEILNPRNLSNASKTSKEIERSSGEFFDGSTFKHYDFAEHLRKKYKIISFEGKLGVYVDGIYELNADLVRQKILQEIPVLQRSRVEEVVYNLQKLHFATYEENTRPFEIVVQNGVVDLLTGNLKPFDPNQINLSKLRVEYKDYSELMQWEQDKKPQEMQIIDKFLLEIASGDMQLVRFLLQMCAYSLWKATPFKKAFILKGSGDNGKSVLLHILQGVLGMHNYAALEFSHLTGDSFKVANLERKLACITNDISKEKIKETNIFKAIVSGDPIEVGAKGIQDKTIVPYSTIIMSANHMPESTDDSKGFFERVYVVPLERDFVEEGIADPSLRGKVTSQAALNYFFYLLVMSSVQLNQYGFVQCAKVKNASLAYRLEHNPAARWMISKGIQPEQLNGIKRADTYESYMQYCDEEELIPMGKGHFYKALMHYYPSLYKKRTSNSEVWGFKTK